MASCANRGKRPCSSSQPRAMRSSEAGRVAVMSKSASCRNGSSRARSVGSFRSSRWTSMPSWSCRYHAGRDRARRSPPGGSILRTAAPRERNRATANGPGRLVARLTMRTPSSSCMCDDPQTGDGGICISGQQENLLHPIDSAASQSGIMLVLSIGPDLGRRLRISAPVRSRQSLAAGNSIEDGSFFRPTS